MRHLARRFFVTLLALAFFGAVLERSAHHHTGKQDTSSAQICLKCCGLCMADAYLAAAPVTEVVLLAAPILFSGGFEAYSGRPVVLDPGIPKRSA